MIKDYAFAIIGYLTVNYNPKVMLCSWSDRFTFYLNRICATPDYGLVQGRELLKMISRAAFNDEALSEAEAVVIIEACQDPRIDNLLLEVNYNEGWQ